MSVFVPRGFIFLPLPLWESPNTSNTSGPVVPRRPSNRGPMVPWVPRQPFVRSVQRFPEGEGVKNKFGGGIDQ
jgi:hypothetical protein